MSKLSFRARHLDAFKPMPIFMAEELPGLPEFSAINRALPQMPSVMQKEEECEHHLQAAMKEKLIIPTPEVCDITDAEAYDRIYPSNYKQPKQLIHMQPFAMEQDIPDYDMDSEDEKWVEAQSRKLNLTPLQFEEMLDRLEKNSEQTVIKLCEAKEILKENEDLIIAVYDYWLNKRLKTQHPLLLTVRTENRYGTAANNPYLAFRRRTEKMQTRKHRKNDEAGYEKMLKLRRDLERAVTLLDMVKKRENMKKELLHLTVDVYEKRYQAQDFNGQLLAEVSALKTSRPAFAPLYTNQFGVHQNWANKVCGKDDIVPRKEKRQYKKRKHKSDTRSGSLEDGNLRSGSGTSGSRGHRVGLGSGLDPLASSDEDSTVPSSHMQPSSLPSDRDDEDTADEGQFAFRRNKNNSYLPPVSGGFGNWPWCSREDGGLADKRYRFALTSIRKPTSRCVGYARRRIGRGGRVILDRYSNDMDDLWSSLDFTIQETKRDATNTTPDQQEWLHFRPKTPPPSEHSQSEESSTSDSEEETMTHAKPEPLPYPFPPEATSICVDVEMDRMDDEPPFTSEFNISDYFSADLMTDLDMALESNSGVLEPETDNSDWRTFELGSSRIQVLPDIGNVFAPPIRPQCSDSANSVNTSSCSNAPTSCTTNNQSTTTSNASVSTQCTSVNVEAQSNQQTKPHRQLFNNSTAASILSKSLVSPTNNRSSGTGGVRLIGTATGTVTSGGSSSSSSGNITNFGNGHQNGPVTLVQNAKGLPNSTHIVNNQSTILLPQKHTPSNLLPGLNKLASLARQQQQQTQNQTQQIPTSGEITLNSNSERLEMEVDGVQSSPCDGKPQQQQLVRASKTNSLAMEVT